MELYDFLKHLNSGAPVYSDSEAFEYMHELSNEAMRITFRLNGSYHTPEEIRALFSQLTGKPVDESFRMFPPFYTDCGKNIHIGKHVFINMGCKFQDQGGITLGDGTFLGNNVVLTFTEGEARFFDDAAKALENNVLKIRTRSSDYLFSVLFNEVVSSYVSQAIEIGDQLDDLETELLAATTSYNIRMQLQLLRKRYMEIKRTVVPLKDQYSRIVHPDSELINETNRPFFNDVNDHLLNAVQLTEGCRETLSSLMDLYISNSDLRMNYIMKRLTIVSTIFIPLTFLVGVWGMNFKFMPELDWKYGYLMAWGIMLAAGLASFLILRSRKWQ